MRMMRFVNVRGYGYLWLSAAVHSLNSPALQPPPPPYIIVQYLHPFTLISNATHSWIFIYIPIVLVSSSSNGTSRPPIIVCDMESLTTDETPILWTFPLVGVTWIDLWLVTSPTIFCNFKHKSNYKSNANQWKDPFLFTFCNFFRTLFQRKIIKFCFDIISLSKEL